MFALAPATCTAPVVSPAADCGCGWGAYCDQAPAVLVARRTVEMFADRDEPFADARFALVRGGAAPDALEALDLLALQQAHAVVWGMIRL